MARWEDVLDVQLDCHRFLTSPEGEAFAASWFASVQEAAGRRGTGPWADWDEAANTGRHWSQSEGIAVFNSEPIWVDDDMMALIEGTANQFAPEPLQPSDLITPEGFLVLPRSLWIDPGKHGEVPLGLRRLSWRLARWNVQSDHRSVLVTLYHDHADPDEVDDEERNRVLDGKRLIDMSKITRFLPTHVATWFFGENHPAVTGNAVQPNPDGRPTVDVSVVFESIDVQLQLQAIWRILTQTIVIREQVRPPRAFVKRAQRAKLPTEHVTIVRLRRRAAHEPREGEPEAINWTHRWVVGYHWRWQWHRDDTRTQACGHIEHVGATTYVCQATGGYHKQILIEPYVKGPADLPLVAPKSRIFLLER